MQVSLRWDFKKKNGMLGYEWLGNSLILFHTASQSFPQQRYAQLWSRVSTWGMPAHKQMFIIQTEYYTRSLER